MKRLNKLKKIKQQISRKNEFKSSSIYWDERYRDGGNSGQGSYGKLATYKAEIINDFIVKNNISSCVEFGCGDGNQLQLYKIDNYLGYDISETVLNLCRNKYKNDIGKTFKNITDYNYASVDLSY
jgi:SAM-dependent methyltransferase